MLTSEEQVQLNAGKVCKNIRMLERILRVLHGNLYLDGRRDDVDSAIFILTRIKNDFRVIEGYITEMK